MAIALRRRYPALQRRIEAYAGMRLVDDLGQSEIIRDVFTLSFDVFTFRRLLVAVMVIFRLVGVGRWLLRSSVVTFADGICVPVYTSVQVAIIIFGATKWAYSSAAN